MRRSVLLSLSLTAMFLAACSSKPKNGECKTSDDCKEQEGYGKVCVQGRCQECGADGDCKAGFVCRQNKCTPRPECESNSDCPGGGTCQDGHCVAAMMKPQNECDTDAQCGPGKGCQGGRCVTRDDTSARAEAVRRCVAGIDQQDNAVHFAFDKSDLDEKDRASLDRLASCLRSVAGARLLVEGHCDERGTADYNIQLGERRSEAVKKYLVNLGLDGGALRTTSYGKEKPLCNEHNESCWARNRRGVIGPDVGGSAMSSTEGLERRAAR